MAKKNTRNEVGPNAQLRTKLTKVLAQWTRGATLSHPITRVHLAWEESWPNGSTRSHLIRYWSPLNPLTDVAQLARDILSAIEADQGAVRSLHQYSLLGFDAHEGVYRTRFLFPREAGRRDTVATVSPSTFDAGGSSTLDAGGSPATIVGAGGLLLRLAEWTNDKDLVELQLHALEPRPNINNLPYPTLSTMSAQTAAIWPVSRDLQERFVRTAIGFYKDQRFQGRARFKIVGLYRTALGSTAVKECPFEVEIASYSDHVFDPGGAPVYVKVDNTKVAWDLETGPVGGVHVSAAVGVKEHAKEEVAPIPMLLWCPACGKRHIDTGAFATKAHHTHACQECGMVWRPALVPTCGVAFLPGFKNSEE